MFTFMFLTCFSACPVMKFLCQQATDEPVNSHPTGLMVFLHVINMPVKSLALPIAPDAIKVFPKQIRVRFKKV